MYFDICILCCVLTTPSLVFFCYLMFAPFTQFTSATPFFGDPGSVVCFDEFVSLVYLLLVLSFTRVKLYSFWPFLSDFLHSVEYSQDPPMLSRTAVFHAFRGWVLLLCAKRPNLPCPLTRWWSPRLSCCDKAAVDVVCTNNCVSVFG